MEVVERIDNKTKALRARLEAVLGKAKDTCERWQEKTSVAAKATDKAMHEHPYRAMGIALGMGVLAGVLIARRWRD